MTSQARTSVRGGGIPPSPIVAALYGPATALSPENVRQHRVRSASAVAPPIPINCQRHQPLDLLISNATNTANNRKRSGRRVRDEEAARTRACHGSHLSSLARLLLAKLAQSGVGLRM